MPLLDLPTEILVIIYESLSDVRTLHNLTRTSRFVRDIYTNHSLSILDLIISTSYPDFARTIKCTVSARQSKGTLRYALDDNGTIKWILPDAFERPDSNDMSEDVAMKLLQSTADIVGEAESLVDWSKTSGSPTDRCLCQPYVSLKDVAVQAFFQLQLCAARMYNVQIISWPRPMTMSSYLSGGTNLLITNQMREKAFGFMLAQLKNFCDRCRMLMLHMIDLLENGYRRLRRHRLHPSRESLLDLLFGPVHEHGAWCFNIRDAVVDSFLNTGVTIGRQRPSAPMFPLMPYKRTDELLREDLKAFDDYIDTHMKRRSIAFGEVGMEFPLTSEEHKECARNYLERFRPLIGLPYADATPVWQLVQPKVPLDPVIVTNCYWAYESTTRVNRSVLANFLTGCEEENKERRTLKQRPRTHNRHFRGHVVHDS